MFWYWYWYHIDWNPFMLFYRYWPHLQVFEMLLIRRIFINVRCPSFPKLTFVLKSRYVKIVFFKDAPIIFLYFLRYCGDKYGVHGSRFSENVGSSKNVLRPIYPRFWAPPICRCLDIRGSQWSRAWTSINARGHEPWVITHGPINGSTGALQGLYRGSIGAL